MNSFDPHVYPFASKRHVVYGKRGIVATGHPLAAQAGLRILQRGGNAIDAAVATAAALTVLEPTSNGIGGDAFSIFWKDGRIYGLNSSGPAPKRIDAQKVRDAGYSQMPAHGPIPVNVPGVPAAWASLVKEHGKLTLMEVLTPAIEYAEEGAPVAPTVAENWEAARKAYQLSGDAMYTHWFDTFTSSGKAPKAGEIFTLPDHAETLRAIGETNAEAFYGGELADKISAYMESIGGYLRADDLASFSPEWVTPIETEYHGCRVLEIPPNGHGIVVLMAMNILKELPEAEADSFLDIHRQIEALKLAFADAMQYVTEPSQMPYTAEDLLSPVYAKERASLITDAALEPQPGEPLRGGTVYLCTADGDGNMVSYIQSNYMGFGSGLVVPGTGIALHNRGANFSLDPAHPNVVTPGKRPYHTIIPGFLMQGEEPLGPFGIMGAFMQPQAHLQVMTSLLRDGYNPQASLDKPRFQWVGGKRVLVERDFPKELFEKLQAAGHEIAYSDDVGSFGRGQMILRAGGAYVGATEKRCDGQVAAY